MDRRNFILGSAALQSALRAIAQSTISPGRGTGKVSSGSVVGNPVLVNSATGSVNGSPGAALAITFGTVPTAGHLLVAFLSNQTGVPFSASGWTSQGYSGDGTNTGTTSTGMAVLTHLVIGGDGATFTFTPSGGDGIYTGVVYEISGQSSATPNRTSIVGTNTATTYPSPSVTPAVIPTLALAAITMNDMGGIQTTVSSGWTYGPAINNVTYHGTSGASRNAQTSNTSTAILNTFTDSGTNSYTAATVLIQ